MRRRDQGRAEGVHRSSAGLHRRGGGREQREHRPDRSGGHSPARLGARAPDRARFHEHGAPADPRAANLGEDLEPERQGVFLALLQQVLQESEKPGRYGTRLPPRLASPASRAAREPTPYIINAPVRSKYASRPRCSGLSNACRRSMDWMTFCCTTPALLVRSAAASSAFARSKVSPSAASARRLTARRSSTSAWARSIFS